MNTLLETLKLRGWHIQNSMAKGPPLPSKLSSQYAKLPASFKLWLNTFDICTNATQTCWFLSRLDYSSSSEAEFRWNEIQLMSLEACSTNAEKSEVNTFWENHFPIALAVHSSHDYLAISLLASNFGALVHGSAPEWETPTTISFSFNDFLAQFESAAISDGPAWPYVLFL
jgi:hypothetical protein